jgi:type IV fimbrial biogenesis protein FimT
MQRNAGFTLLELMIVISIVAILTAIAVPSFDYLNNQRISQGQVESLQRALSMARQMAIAKNRQTVVCPSNNGSSCSNSKDWSFGYMVYVEKNGNSTFNADQDELIEYVTGVKNVAARQGSSGLAHALTSSSSLPVKFSAQGSAVLSNQTLTYCDNEGEARFEVVVSNSGRIKIARDNIDSSCS